MESFFNQKKPKHTTLLKKMTHRRYLSEIISLHSEAAIRRCSTK